MVCARAGEVAMEASNTGQYSLVRFVAPSAGSSQISANFEDIHFGLSTTDVHVLHDDKTLFDADIDGYGGDLAFYKVQGASPTAEYSTQIKMKFNVGPNTWRGLHAEVRTTFCGEERTRFTTFRQRFQAHQ